MVVAETNIIIQTIDAAFIAEKGISLQIARMDLIHPVVSGNKLFKLHYFIEQAIKEGKNTIVTAGGAYSNHLVAAAFYCNEKKLNCIGIVRGEEPENKSHTLLSCEKYNMKLIFVSRKEFSNINKEKAANLSDHDIKDIHFIPEGGFDTAGTDGASLILPKLSSTNATHICVSVGTATTLSGLLKSAESGQMIIGVPVVKGLADIEERLIFLQQSVNLKKPVIWDNYHFGGYARKKEELIDFMNDFYSQYQIPTDFVYTGKLMYAVINKIVEGYFPAGSRIVCLHTGGLQGNQSLPANTLVF